jgi:PhnB protein
MKITSYLVFNGQAEEATNYYADILGGTIENFYRFRDMPPAEGMPPISEEYGNLIMHCCIDGGKNFPNGTMSIADTLPSDPRDFGNGGHILTLSVDSAEQAESIFARLAADARRILCPMQEVFYAKRYGELVDKYGILWAVMYEETPA